MIVEWNQHIFSPNTATYPLHDRAAYRPDMSRHPIDPLGAYIPVSYTHLTLPTILPV